MRDLRSVRGGRSLTPAGKVNPGMRFGLLTVTQFVGVTPVYRKHVWSAKCDCGNEVVVKSQELLKGDTKSCGCLHRAAVVARNRANAKHRKHGSPEYKSWRGAKDRCLNPRSKDAKNYSARGITMCQQWIDSFDQFLADMGPRPEGTSLDRIDNDGPYSPENCRWADCRTQGNNRRTSKRVTEDGVTLTITEWARKLGVTDGAIRLRLLKKGSVYGDPRRTRKTGCA